jgi:HAMP domain-containing protein
MVMERDQPRGKKTPGMKALEGRAQGRIDSSAKTGQQVLEDLESLKSAVGELQRRGMGEKESKAMGQLGQRQGMTRKSTESLKEDMEKFSQKTPLLGQEPVEHLKAAGEAMQGAEGGLSDRNPGAAVTDEREALYRLSQAQQKLQEARDRVAQGMMGKGMPMPRWAGGQQRGTEEGAYGAMLREVQLPTPEDYKVPKEFRQDILDAMRAPSPRGFEEQNKKYYRKLVE